jgi:hypothetical protein
MSETVECIECAEQCKTHETDGGHCRSCGAECQPLDAIYGKDGLYPDPDFIDKNQPVERIGVKELLALPTNEAAIENYAKGFAERLKKREATFAQQAKEQAPNAAFMAREYTL